MGTLLLLLRRRPLLAALPLLLAAGTAAPAQDHPFTVVSWNVESGGARPDSIARRIRDYQGVSLWGLSEVAGDADARLFEAAAEDGEGTDFERVVGTTGGADRLAVLYDAGRFELVGRTELHEMNPGNRVRSPLVAHLRERSSGRELLFVVNHLYRSRAEERHRQAQQLNAWAREQTLPVVAVGDYNFDWEVEGGDARHDAGYDNLTREGALSWVRPARLVKTNCSPRFDSVLDFVFVNPAAGEWTATSEIDVEPGDCPDGSTRSDHRPVRAVFAPAVRLPPPTRDELLQRIERLEAELQELREMVRRLP